jgi:ubiquinone/menaquinone biosynthesis C-methylase UbiE
LLDQSVDVVLLYDTFHDLEDGKAVLKELHRILKPNGILSFSDHHLKEQNILEKVTGGDLFILSQMGKKTYGFAKQA